tara:strand:- start:448 stop:1926 length:1479 start_codon:yes stop_codon:yes gene_type:complete
MRLILLSFSVFLFFNVAAYEKLHEEKDTIGFKISPDDEVLSMIDKLMQDKYYNAFVICTDSLSIPNETVGSPLYDSVLIERLNKLDQQSPFDLRYNEHTKAFINLYVNKKRKLSQSVLGLAPYYFPMIEELLDQYQIPLEIKYLAVVESALSNKARSRVGAQGLWQFMYRTGRMYGLQSTSYYDDRMDPYKSTLAACRYLKDLYDMYNDWSLVLAAYNSGPGNVNKAIRRSGGHKDYWKIRPFLPLETRGYVPAFIAVNYMMNYAEEHSLFAYSTQPFEFASDTVHLTKAISFEQLSNYLPISNEELEFYNPQYKLAYIPKNDTKKPYSLCLPKTTLGLFLTNEKAMYADIRRQEALDSIAGKEKKTYAPELIVHRVRSGEFLGYIAEKYHCSVRDLMAWNNLRSSRINPGDRLTVYTKNQTSATPSVQKSSSKQTAQEGDYKVHVVKSGDTLWDIAKMYNDTSVNELKQMNSHLNFRRLKPGMKIKVKHAG